MGNQRKPERSLAGGAKQYRVRCDLRNRRGDQPWLRAVGRALRAFRAVTPLRRGGLAGSRRKHDQRENHLERWHELA